MSKYVIVARSDLLDAAYGKGRCDFIVASYDKRVDAKDGVTFLKTQGFELDLIFEIREMDEPLKNPSLNQLKEFVDKFKGDEKDEG